MATTKRGAKINKDKNSQAHREWMMGKKLNRPAQQWVTEEYQENSFGSAVIPVEGHWEKVKHV